MHAKLPWLIHVHVETYQKGALEVQSNAESGVVVICASGSGMTYGGLQYKCSYVFYK